MKTQNNSQIKIIHSIASIIIDWLSIISSIIILIVESLYNWSSWWWIILTPVITFAGLWILLYLFVFGISFTCSKTKQYKFISKFYHFMFNLGYSCLIGCGRITIKVKGLEKMPEDTHFLLVSNHRSKFDNMIQSYVLKDYNIAYISKPSNFKIPFGNRYMNRNLYLKLNRESLREGIKTIYKAIDLLENNITNIGIFPEGTRSLDGKLGEFKPGSFKIATVAQKPIVIVSMKNTEKIHKNFPFKRTIVEMDMIDVLYDDIRTMNTIELSEKVRNIIDEDLKNEKEV